MRGTAPRSAAVKVALGPTANGKAACKPNQRKARSKVQAMWTTQEVTLLQALVEGYASPLQADWNSVAAELSRSLQYKRTAKQCREKWKNHLHPSIQKTGAQPGHLHVDGTLPRPHPLVMAHSQSVVENDWVVSD